MVYFYIFFGTLALVFVKGYFINNKSINKPKAHLIIKKQEKKSKQCLLRKVEAVKKEKLIKLQS